MNGNVSKINDIDGSDEVEVVKEITLYSGICYKLNLKANSRQGIFNAMQLWFLDSVPVDEVPELRIYFTSEENSNGIISLLWYYGDHYKLEIYHKKHIV